MAAPETISYRVGESSVSAPMEWTLRVGGWHGPTLVLPSGSYSDDTQLRLAVSRATRGNGDFDVAAFAKIELPVWSSYSLGAGRGTSAAASNLAEGSVSWFSNFFGGWGGRGYFHAGGNGAAMRTQPHVWKCDPEQPEIYVRDVLKDAITTHGHPRGFCGALFHALCVGRAVAAQMIPGPGDWIEFVSQLRSIPKLVQADEQLGQFWLGPWEEGFGSTLADAVAAEVEYALGAIEFLKSKPFVDPRQAYQTALSRLGCFDDQTRGAGFNTALAAAALSYLASGLSNEDAILLAANTLGSDTDTIGSMAGAILGAARPHPLKWNIQDREYITAEAIRMSNIAEGKQSTSFQYPELRSWRPPTTQIDAVGAVGKQLCLAGLGPAKPIGKTFPSSDGRWQWLKLQFGQTVLVQRRAKLRQLI
ncbi:ADP-ribosylglycohydrolase [Rhizobiales bacterium GAS113]|nr:ADP-ribosylglycohydrolase [Rhizobiales bacterium GAS113]